MNQKVFHSQSCTGKICENIYPILKQLKQSKTINTKLSGLVKFNEFLIHDKKTGLVIGKSDYVKVQQLNESLTKVEFQDAEIFRQLVLDSGKARNYGNKGNIGGT